MQRIADQWKDYECLDAGEGEKLERWGSVLLRRPDPQAIWNRGNPALWQRVDAHYHRSRHGGGRWELLKPIPETWTIRYRELTFKVSPTGFKHTGLFPEQAVNWDWMQNKIVRAKAEGRTIRILNLFAYTGGATMACASAGADEVVHVDASRGIVQWAKENMTLSHLEGRTIRFLVDDAMKFLAREQRRGRTYHGIVMDPPSYGRGPGGEIWKWEDQLSQLIQAAGQVLDPQALFFLINSYTTGYSSVVLDNLLRTTLGKTRSGFIVTGEVVLPIRRDQLRLPCGIYGCWSDEDDEMVHSV